jgi:hypothetical protein
MEGTKVVAKKAKVSTSRFVSLNADPKKAQEAGYVVGYWHPDPNAERGGYLVRYQSIDLSIPEGVALIACKRFDGASNVKLPNGDSIIVGKNSGKALELLGLAA